MDYEEEEGKIVDKYNKEYSKIAQEYEDSETLEKEKKALLKRTFKEVNELREKYNLKKFSV
ncbi:MAG: hypothetical protein RSB77_04255 [Bacilli bacterium]